MFLWDVLFPRRCLNCGRYGAYVCMGCANGLKPLHSQRCLYCGKPSLWGLTHPTCRRRDGVDGRISLYYYNAVLKKIIAGLKYRLVTDAFPDLFFIVGRQALFLTEVFRGLGYPPLQPIPLSSGKMAQRGFNQARIISRIFTSLLPLAQADLLYKTKDNLSQATLPGHAQRKSNVRGAFAVRGGLPPPEKMVLIDDVITSGETVKEAARVLKAAGVKKVFALSVAKG